MRFRIFFLLIVVASLALMGNSQAAMGGIKLKDFPGNSELVNSLSLHSGQDLGRIITLPLEEFDQEEAARMIERLDQLPSSLLSKIRKEGISLKLFTGQLTDNPTASHLAGLTPRGYKNKETTWDDVPGIGGGRTVLVKIGFSGKGMGHGSVNLELHELAHSVDRFVLSEIRFNRKFQGIWKEEKAKLFPGQPYFLSFPEEYFAETFAMYFMGGGERLRLKEKAPLTWQFFSTLN
jgi:Pro-Pro endopeptidase